MALADHPGVKAVRELIPPAGTTAILPLEKGLPDGFCDTLVSAAERWGAAGLARVSRCDGATYLDFVSGAFGFPGPTDMELYPGSDGVAVALYPYAAPDPKSEHAAVLIWVSRPRLSATVPEGWDAESLRESVGALLADALGA